MTDLYLTGASVKSTLTIDWSAYPFSLPAVLHMDAIQLEQPVTFFVGENGTGKSTLLEAIAVAYGFNPEGGSRNFHFATAETHSALHQAITLVKGPYQPQDGYFLRAESFYNVITEIDNIDVAASYGGTSLHQRSHGESVLTLVLERFYGRGLYLLDEPEAALSPARQMALLSRMHALVQQQSQFVIATHSPILLSYPSAQIYVFGEDGIRLTPYLETEHYQLTKQFLNHPEGMLNLLLKP